LKSVDLAKIYTFSFYSRCLITVQCMFQAIHACMYATCDLEQRDFSHVSRKSIKKCCSDFVIDCECLDESIFTPACY